MIPEFHKLLIKMYLDWRNNYLTIAIFAHDKHLSVTFAKALVREGRRHWKEYNASADSGIKSIEKELKELEKATSINIKL